MKNINLQQIFYFKITMKCTSFSQAARLAYTTQSTISKNISLLEKIIGEPLFIRQKKGILPTQRALILNLELTDIYEKIDALFYKHSYNQNHFTIGFCQNISFATAIPNFFLCLPLNRCSRMRILNFIVMKITILLMVLLTVLLTWALSCRIQPYPIRILNFTRLCPLSRKYFIPPTVP